MKFFSLKKLKHIAWFLLVQLILPMVLIILLSMPVMAAEETIITREDALRGLAIAVGIIVIAKVAKTYFSHAENVKSQQDKKAPAGYTDEELELLAKLIYAEARGEPFEGQVAVGAVVINRVKSPQYPKTISEVIFQPGQFATIADGQINLKPNEIAYKAAQQAMSGNDPSLGALFFYNAKKTKNMEWWSTRKTTVVIGNHTFAK